jgi:hypothetical protein
MVHRGPPFPPTPFSKGTGLVLAVVDELALIAHSLEAVLPDGLGAIESGPRRHQLSPTIQPNTLGPVDGSGQGRTRLDRTKRKGVRSRRRSLQQIDEGEASLQVPWPHESSQYRLYG